MLQELQDGMMWNYMKTSKVDNIPAMLTEGEFVIKKSSAQKIGYNKLNYMNKTGKIPVIDARKRKKRSK